MAQLKITDSRPLNRSINTPQSPLSLEIRGSWLAAHLAWACSAWAAGLCLLSAERGSGCRSWASRCVGRRGGSQEANQSHPKREGAKGRKWKRLLTFPLPVRLLEDQTLLFDPRPPALGAHPLPGVDHSRRETYECEGGRLANTFEHWITTETEGRAQRGISVRLVKSYFHACNSYRI